MTLRQVAQNQQLQVDAINHGRLHRYNTLR